MDKELKAKITADNSDFKNKTKQSEQAAKSFTDKMVSYGKMLVGAWGFSKIVQGIKNFISTAVAAYDVQAKAEESLLVALKGREDIQKNIIRQAQELQKTTLFGDEQTIEGASRLAQLLGQDEKGIKRLLPLVQDLAQAKFGGNLVTAADLVAKSVGSSTNALSRYGIEITGAVGSSERLESAIAALNKQVGGQAQAAAEVGTGSLTQLKNIWGDLKEVVGKTSLETKAYKDTIYSLKDAILRLTDQIDDLNTVMGSESLSNWDKFLLRWGRFTKVGREALDQTAGLIRSQEGINSTLIEQGPVVDHLSENFGSMNDELAAYNSLLDDMVAGIAQSFIPLQNLIGLSSEFTPPDFISDPKMLEDLEAWNNSITESLKDISTQYTSTQEAAVAFADILMQSSADGANSLKEFAKIAVQTAKRIIAAEIAQGIATAVKGALVKVPFPFNIVAAGIAGGAAAALFNSIIPNFAEGGAVSGPTMALVGEAAGISRTNPEYIGTARQLQQMGIGSTGGTLTARVSRGDLLFILNEAKYHNDNNY